MKPWKAGNAEGWKHGWRYFHNGRKSDGFLNGIKFNLIRLGKKKPPEVTFTVGAANVRSGGVPQFAGMLLRI